MHSLDVDYTYFSAGIHPWDIDNTDVEKSWDRLLTLSKDKNMLAVGECGIDKMIDTDIRLQEELFLRHIRLSEEINKPLIIHCVKAIDEIIRIKKMIKPRSRWIIHGFRGKKEQALQLINQDIYYSFGKYYNAEALLLTPAERLLAETDDCGDSIYDILSNIAKTKGEDEETIIRQIENNTSKIFNVK